jgi:hypothetical protein
MTSCSFFTPIFDYIYLVYNLTCDTYFRTEEVGFYHNRKRDAGVYMGVLVESLYICLLFVHKIQCAALPSGVSPYTTRT